MPLHGVILIHDEIIFDILPIKDANIEILANEYIVEDLGNLYIFPGLVDLNVAFNSESPSTVTKQAISGGITTIVTADLTVGEIFTDIIRLLMLHDQNLNQITAENVEDEIFGFKSFLVSQGFNSKVLQNIEKALQIAEFLPIFIHPELATAENMYHATPFRQIAPEKRNFQCKIVIHEESSVFASKFKLNSSDEDSDYNESSDSCSEEFSPDIQINDFSLEGNIIESASNSIDSMKLSVPERDKKRVSLPALLGAENLIKIQPKNSPRHHSVQCIGITNRPVPIQDIPFINKGILVEQAYAEHISKFPPDWEIAAIKKVMDVDSDAKIHFLNISSSQAIEMASSYKNNGKKVTCETSLPYLYFSEADIKPGDTRYKLNPPIRDHNNNMNLWQMLKNNEIDCISSYHQPVAPPLKFLGDFKRAVNGVISIGFNLQTI